MNVCGTLVYSDKITVNDPKNYVETRFSKPLTTFYIKFLDQPPADAKKDVFSKTNTNKTIEKKYKGDTIEVECILPAFLPIKDLRMLIAAVLDVHMDAIDLGYPMLLDDIANLDVYESNSCIGLQPLTVNIKVTTKPRFNGYDSSLLNILSKYNQFINSCKLKKQTIYPMVTNMNYVAYTEKGIKVDVVRLFNLNQSSSKYPKICLHSDKLNNFNDQPNPLIAEIKTLEPTLRPLQGVNASRNECAFLASESVADDGSVRLTMFSVLENGLIIFYFKNLRECNSGEEFAHIIEEWIKKRLGEITKTIHLEECVYDLNYDIKAFKFTHLTHTLHLCTDSDSKVQDLNALNIIPVFKSVYNMKSTFRENGPQLHSISTQQLINRVSNINGLFSPTTMSFYFNTIIQVGIRDEGKGLYIEIRNSTDLMNTNLIFTAILGRLNAKSSPGPKKLLDAIKAIDAKTRLKQLKTIDPIIFGNRITDNGSERDYSQIVQTNEQRPSIVTDAEFVELRASMPDSCLDIENQLTHDRLKLVCPFSEFPVINYHAMHNQTCVIKCTKNFANKFQYDVCDNSLNGKGNDKTVENKFSSNAILKFSPLVDVGRRCYLPPEIINIFPNCHLLRCPAVSDIAAYLVGKYKLAPFILERYEDHYIIGTEYMLNRTYILTIVTEQNTKFILCDTETSRPIELRSDSENGFIQQLIKVSTARNENAKFVKFINSIMGRDYKTDIKLTDLVADLMKEECKFYCVLENPDAIVAMSWNDLLYTIPHFYANGIQADIIIRFLAKGKSQYFPDLSSFKPDFIERMYIDFTDKKVHAIEYMGVTVLINPIIVEKPSVPIEIVDTMPFLLKTISNPTKPLSKTPIHVELIDANFVILTYINLIIQSGEKLTKEKLIETMKGTLSNKNEIVYIGHTPSWRLSRIDKKLIDNISFADSNVIRLIYEYTKANYKLIHDDVAEYLYERQIY